MAKNNVYIPKKINRTQKAMFDYLKTSIDKTLPYVYSAIALALWRVLDESEDEKIEDISTIISESQIVWNECINEGKSIIDWCEEVTGFDIRNAVT